MPKKVSRTALLEACTALDVWMEMLSLVDKGISRILLTLRQNRVIIKDQLHEVQAAFWRLADALVDIKEELELKLAEAPQREGSES